LSERFPCVGVGLVRNPIDVWLSMHRSSKTFHDKTLIYYRQFVEDLLRRNVPIIKYEDLTNNPKEIVYRLYKALDMMPPETLDLSENVIGDINFADPERTFEKNMISKNVRRDFTQDECFLLKKRPSLQKF
jgi:hypothetical protein